MSKGAPFSGVKYEQAKGHTGKITPQDALTILTLLIEAELEEKLQVSGGREIFIRNMVLAGPYGFSPIVSISNEINND
ncbi:hypothetical protein KJ965_02295 [Patescibacteria group bacterium]|nr:hypothetical protein [Patescibacteria group bacterium]